MLSDLLNEYVNDIEYDNSHIMRDFFEEELGVKPESDWWEDDID